MKDVFLQKRPFPNLLCPLVAFSITRNAKIADISGAPKLYTELTFYMQTLFQYHYCSRCIREGIIIITAEEEEERLYMVYKWSASAEPIVL